MVVLIQVKMRNANAENQNRTKRVVVAENSKKEKRLTDHEWCG